MRRSGSGAFIPYVCAGDPDKEFTFDLVKALSRAGADIVELGLPFSDPVADGPIIQRSMQRSLSGGFRTHDLMEIIGALRSHGMTQPIVVMTYYNPVLKFGIESFCSGLADAGADGILVVDLPPEESDELEKAASRHGLDIIRLVAPSSSDSRIDLILSKASGFVYVVSVSGTTGTREAFPQSTESLLKRVVARSPLPVALGFGISDPGHVRSAIAAGASGVVVGSKLLSILSTDSVSRDVAISRAERFAEAMKAAAMGVKKSQS